MRGLTSFAPTVALLVAFIVLRLGGQPIPWWVVFSPVWIALAIAGIVAGVEYGTRGRR